MSDDPSKKTCRLLAGPAAAAAQLSLASIVLAALLLRRHRENPKRERRVFLFDVSKQFVSSAAAHASGLAFSVAVAASASATAAGGGRGEGTGPAGGGRGEGTGTAGGGGGGGGGTRRPSECGWYLVLFSVDTIIGSALAILLHRLAVAAATKLLVAEKRRRRHRARLSPPPPTHSSAAAAPKPEPRGALLSFAAAVSRCGDYGGPPPRLDLFLSQLAEWTIAVAAARLCCGFSVLALREPLSAVASGVDAFFSSGYPPSVELFSVMLLGPLLMNAGQALVQDGVLRARRAAAAGGGLSSSFSACAASEANGDDGGRAEEGETELLASPSSSSVSPSFSSHHP